MEELVERPVMSKEEFKEYIKVKKDGSVLYFRDYFVVSKCKSVRRSIRRGHISVFGEKYPRRPFNNRKDTHIRSYKENNIKTVTGRVQNKQRKDVYESLLIGEFMKYKKSLDEHQEGRV